MAAGAPGPSSAAAARTSSPPGSLPASYAPDFGPRRLHPTAGAVLVGARPPLVAFNVELAPPATLEDARAIAAAIREGGAEGLQAVRAIGLWLEHRGCAQVSTNIEDHRAIASRACSRQRSPVTRPDGEAELVGLAPRVRVRGFPEDIPVRNRATIEDALARERTKLPGQAMAQTKRKRRSKHRGTAAGTIEARGRTGRPPSAEERKKQPRGCRRARSG